MTESNHNPSNTNPSIHALTHDELRQFTGDLDRYRHPIARRIIYTPGIRHMAERAGAYWLIDEIALWLGSNAIAEPAKTDPRILELHFWKLRVKDDSASLTARADRDEESFYTKRIGYTDFPLAQIDIWAAYDGAHWTLYLPSEH